MFSSFLDSKATDLIDKIMNFKALKRKIRILKIKSSIIIPWRPLLTSSNQLDCIGS